MYVQLHFLSFSTVLKRNSHDNTSKTLSYRVRDFNHLRPCEKHDAAHIRLIFMTLNTRRRPKPNYVEPMLHDGVIIHVLHPIIPWQLLVKVPCNVTAVCVISRPSASKTTSPPCNSIAGSVHWSSWRAVLFVNFIIWQPSWRWHRPVCEYMCPIYLMYLIKTISEDLA